MVLICAVWSMILLAMAAGSDLKRRTIPNILPIGIAASFVLAAVTEPGSVNAGASLAVAGAVFAAGLVLFSLNVLGGGDVKLLAAMALWAGTAEIATLLFVTAVAGGVLGIAAGLWWASRHVKTLWGVGAAESDAATRVSVPYGVAIAIAGIAVLASRV